MCSVGWEYNNDNQKKIIKKIHNKYSTSNDVPYFVHSCACFVTYACMNQINLKKKIYKVVDPA